MQYVFDGLMYDEYPDELERIAGLREAKNEWKKLAISQTRKVFELRDELAKLKKEMAK